MAPTKDEVFEKVKEALVDALGVDDDEVTPEATMVGDLGAESIDFLDIVFRLEKAFGIEIPRSELFPEDVLTNAEYVKDGRVTPRGHRVAQAAHAVCRSIEVRRESGGAGIQHTADRQRFVPVHSEQGRGDGVAGVRWFWIDRFVEFESGRRAVAEKAVTLAEEELDDYVPGFPVLSCFAAHRRVRPDGRITGG